MSQIIIIRPIPTKNVQQLYLPLGPLYLAESLLAAGYEVSIVDEDNENALKKIYRITSNNTICFCMSVMSGRQIANAISIAKKLKARYNIPLIWGGVHITALPKQSLKNQFVDYVVWGEGENTLLSLIEMIRSKKFLPGKKGIGYKNGDVLYVGENSGYTSLDRTFHLPYHLLDMDRYAKKLMIGAAREFPIWTSRGCPFRCKFCSNSSSVWPNTKIRYHTIDHIVNDVRTLVTNYGADMISFSDEGFLINEKRFIDILKAIRKEGIFIKYRFTARVNLLLKLKEETWKILKEYGVVSIGAAPESGSQRILDYMGKGITLEQIYKVDELLSKYNFYKTYNMLICTPRETIEDLKLTLKLVLNLAKTSMSSPYPFGTLHKYIPLPGTELYLDAIKCGFSSPQTLEEWGQVELFDDWDRFSYEKVARPWVSDATYVEKATSVVEKLNMELKGPKTDKNSVKEILGKVSCLV